MLTVKKLGLWSLENKKHKWNSIFAMFLCSMLMSFMSFNVFALGGLGSKSDPYEIRSCDDLHEIANRMQSNEKWSEGKYFILRADITVNDPFDVLPPFSGMFDGNGHTITLVDENNALFNSVLSGGIVKDLTIKGYGYFTNWNHGEIIKCSSFNAKDTKVAPGNKVRYSLCGIALANDGSIQDCTADGKFFYGITQYNHGKITGCLIDGEIYGNAGIAKVNECTGYISNCRVKSNIVSAEAASGLLCTNDGIIFNCAMNGKFLEKKNHTYFVFDNKFGIAVQCVFVGQQEDYKFFDKVGKAYECGHAYYFKDCCRV